MGIGSCAEIQQVKNYFCYSLYKYHYTNAQIYRSIFGDDNVIEHHSNIDENTNTQERKLAAENWDAPLW